VGYPIEVRMQKGYDRNYYFIASFIGDHCVGQKFRKCLSEKSHRGLALTVSGTRSRAEPEQITPRLLQCARMPVITTSIKAIPARLAVVGRLQKIGGHFHIRTQFQRTGRRPRCERFSSLSKHRCLMNEHIVQCSPHLLLRANIERTPYSKG
jgi:hypothetical protein